MKAFDLLDTASTGRQRRLENASVPELVNEMGSLLGGPRQPFKIPAPVTSVARAPVLEPRLNNNAFLDWQDKSAEAQRDQCEHDFRRMKGYDVRGIFVEALGECGDAAFARLRDAFTSGDFTKFGEIADELIRERHGEWIGGKP